ncbi:MAG TPA: amidohydrolase family protein [Alphaproteobacteria bacterium]|nr:amidohydrolase family protein [Alphaproteobacteria bacterium]
MAKTARASGSGNGGGPAKRAEIRELPRITIKSDTRDVLAHAAKDARQYKDYFIADIDAHVTETAFWSEITDRIDNDYLRHAAKAFKDRGGSPPGLLNATPGMLYQDLFGRIPHQQQQAEAVAASEGHRQVVLTRRAMDSMGIDTMVVFPTPMLVLGMHPQAEVEVALGTAFNRWLCEEVLPEEDRLKGLMYLPFNDPVASVDVVEEFADKPGVIGFTVVSTRYKPVHHNDYMRLYSAIQASGKPLAFHSGFHWGDESMKQTNRFLSMHALSFCYFNMIHMTNWIINGIPERFPKLKVIWVESGLAWVPFLMQRLDSEYMMRSSEAPLLKRKPSDYMREMYYTSQPLETSNMKLTEATFEAINAETQLLFASDWPHWDFDLPNSITHLPFLTEKAKRNILGLNAARLFGFEVPKTKLAKEPGAPAREKVPA